MKNLFYPLLCFISFLNLNAQSPSGKMTRGEFEKVKDLGFDAFLMSTDQSYFTFGGERKHVGQTSEGPFFIKEYDLENLKLKNTREISNWEFGKVEPVFKQAVHLQDATHLIFDGYDKKEDKRYVLARTVLDGQKLSPYKVLMSLASEEDDEYLTSITVSADSSKLGILLFGNEGVEYLKPEISVFQSDLEKLWVQTGIITGDKRFYTVYDLAVDNQGGLITAIRATPPDMDDRLASDILGNVLGDPKVEKDYVVSRTSPDGEYTKVELEQFDKYLHSITVGTDLNDQLIITGFYSNRKDDNPDGYYVLACQGQSLNVESKNFHELDRSFISELNHSQAGKIKSLAMTGMSDRMKGLEHYKVLEILAKEDGGLTLVAERNKLAEALNMMGGNGLSKEANFVSHDIVVMDLSSELKPHWIKRIPKRQTVDAVFRRSPALSHALVQKDDELVFLFNYKYDKLEALRDNDNDELTPWLGMNPSVIMASVDSDGNIEYTEHIDHEDADALLIDNVFKNKEGDILVILQNTSGRKARFGKIQF